MKPQTEGAWMWKVYLPGLQRADVLSRKGQEVLSTPLTPSPTTARTTQGLGLSFTICEPETQNSTSSPAGQGLLLALEHSSC